MSINHTLHLHITSTPFPNHNHLQQTYHPQITIMAGTIEKIKAKVDNVLHKDRTTTHDDPTGPHSSHAANAADPRVDSDRVGPAGNTTGAHTTGTHTGTGLTGSHGTTGIAGTTGGLSHGSDPTGPHSSHTSNQLDPRVDSDRFGTAGNTSGAGGVGAGQYGSNTTHTGTHGTTGGLTGSHNTHGHNDPTGPHSSHAGNQIDPRVDSDRLGAAGNTAGAGGIGAGQYSSNTGSGLTGSHNTHGTTGLNDNNPYNTHGTTGSGLTGTHGAHTGTVGSGNSANTAGPHNSDMLNKVDPRVDSNLDGSKTVGGNKTYQ
jgi:hypothetical protein